MERRSAFWVRILSRQIWRTLKFLMFYLMYLVYRRNSPRFFAQFIRLPYWDAILEVRDCEDIVLSASASVHLIVGVVLGRFSASTISSLLSSLWPPLKSVHYGALCYGGLCYPLSSTAETKCHWSGTFRSKQSFSGLAMYIRNPQGVYDISPMPRLMSWAPRLVPTARDLPG
jgi:hypothetical protein